MTKKEIVNYVVETPHNVNKRILGQQLDELQKNVSWNDLKDKPFGTETKVILEKQIISGFADDTRGNGTVTVYFDLDLIAGETVTVFFDGNTYEMPVMQHDVVPAMVYIQDEAVCPVTIQHMTTTNKTVIVASSDLSTSHEIGIYRETVHKLDAKYLPGGNLVLTVDCFDVENVIWHENYTFDEIHTAALEGRLVMKLGYINSFNGGSIDSVKFLSPASVTLENHEFGASVGFFNDGMGYGWSPDGFSFGID